MFDGHNKYGYSALAGIVVTATMVMVGWYGLAIASAGMTVSDLLTYEWLENPDRYELFGDNVHISRILIAMLVMLYMIVYLLSLTL